MWFLLEVENTCNTSLASSCENNFSMTCSSALPLVGRCSLCSSFIYSFFSHCVQSSIETHSTYVTQHPLHMRCLLYIVPCVRCRTSQAWTGWCSKDGRRWWRAVVPALRHQIMTKWMVWTSQRLCSSETAITDEKLARKHYNYNEFFKKASGKAPLLRFKERLLGCSTNQRSSMCGPAPFCGIGKVLPRPRLHKIVCCLLRFPRQQREQELTSGTVQGKFGLLVILKYH